MSSNAKHVLIFLVLTFAASWALMFHVIQLGGMKNAGFFVLLIMWVPGLVSLLYRLIARLGFGDVGWRFGGLKNWALAIGVPFLVAAIAYGAQWGLGISSFEMLSPEKLQILLISAPVVILFGFIAALGEELGWRGFLIPKLIGVIRWPLLASGLIWGLWHYPLILWGGYASSDLPVLSVALFTLMIVGAGVFIGWLRVRSGSMWVATAYHAAHNYFLQSLFESFNRPGAYSQYLGGESGVVPCLAYIFVLFVGYKIMAKRQESVI